MKIIHSRIGSKCLIVIADAFLKLARGDGSAARSPNPPGTFASAASPSANRLARRWSIARMKLRASRRRRVSEPRRPCSPVPRSGWSVRRQTARPRFARPWSRFELQHLAVSFLGQLVLQHAQRWLASAKSNSRSVGSRSTASSIASSASSSRPAPSNRMQLPTTALYLGEIRRHAAQLLLRLRSIRPAPASAIA